MGKVARDVARALTVAHDPEVFGPAPAHSKHFSVWPFWNSARRLSSGRTWSRSADLLFGRVASGEPLHGIVLSASMHIVQILLPLYDQHAKRHERSTFDKVVHELSERF